jgi:hypothetical protein
MERSSPFQAVNRRPGQQRQPALDRPLVAPQDPLVGLSRDAYVAVQIAEGLREVDRATQNLRIAREHFERLRELASR